jgi:Protein of unknown function, DUF547
MKKLFLLIALFCVAFNAQAQNINAFFDDSDVFLRKYVKDTKVDYAGIKSDPSLLDKILDNASKVDLTNESKFNVKAFWVNAYNLNVIKGIVSKYPIKSALEVEGFFNKVTYTVAKQTLTLDDIENKKLREPFKDPYIHFALVCGANGCPPLIGEAYMPDTLNEQMHDQAGLAINNPNFIKVNPTSKVVEISKIFEWYKADFLADYKKEMDFINIFREKKIGDDFEVKIYDYDWTLNSK